MSKIAEKDCKKIYVTDDNPKNEIQNCKERSLKKISKNKLYNIGDRTTAIKKHYKISPKNYSYWKKDMKLNKFIKIKLRYFRQNIVRKTKIPKKFLKKKLYNQNQLFLKRILNRKQNLNFEGLLLILEQ